MTENAENDRLHCAKIERLGEFTLVSQLLEAGFEVAKPWSDSGIDLIVYDSRASGRFVARPIQLKVNTGRGFGINEKYDKYRELLIVHIWEVKSDSPRIFALTYPETLAVARERGWLEKDPWKERGRFVVPSAGKPLEEILLRDKYLMNSKEDWQRRILT